MPPRRTSAWRELSVRGCGHAPTPLSTVSAACASARSGPLLLICDYLSIRSDRAYIVGDPVTQPVRRIVQAVNGIAVWGPWYYYSHITVPLPCVGGCLLAPANFYYYLLLAQVLLLSVSATRCLSARNEVDVPVWNE